MSKNNFKGKENDTRESFNDSKLKEIKDSNIKCNNGKDIEVISRNYIKETNNNYKHYDLSKNLPKQITKLQLGEKTNNEEDEEESGKERLTDKIKENLPNWNESYKYIDKIKELEETIKQMNLEYSNEIKKHKDEVEKKEKDIKKLITTNNNLKNSLEILTQRLDKLLMNSNQQKIKLNKTINNNNNQENLQHQLDIKEKELKNQQQLINILTKDNKNIRNILNNLNNFGINEKNINFTEKIQQQYQEIQNLKKNLQEYKLKLEQKQSSTQKNLTSKEINFNTDEDKSIQKKPHIFLNKNKKVKINSISNTASSYNIHKISKYSNKSQSVEVNKNNPKKKLIYHRINSSYDNNSNYNVETIFTNEEINTIKNCFYDEEKYESFMNKINILEKASLSKEKEMKMNIKLIENKLKQKEKELLQLKKESKEKENTIISLNIQNKELKKNKEDLINKINFLTKTLNLLDQKNQMILKKNDEIKNSIFNIDGIIEAKSKEGNPIPLLIENNNNINIKNNNQQKNVNNSINQSSREEKNSYKYTNSDENEEFN